MVDIQWFKLSTCSTVIPSPLHNAPIRDKMRKIVSESTVPLLALCI